jgi:AcrR family transcriptional regulator
MTFEPLTPERRRAMTREHLLRAAEIVFAEHGFHAATLDEIAATAGFSKGAVYSNFKSKDDLFLALLQDRMDRQFAVTTEVLETGPHDRADQLPRMRELINSGTFLWDDTWQVLYLEFVLYARRNPEAREKLAAAMQRETEFVQELIGREYSNVGAPAKYPPRHLAVLSLALFNGLGMSRLVDPGLVDADALDTTLSFLYDSMGVDTDG